MLTLCFLLSSASSSRVFFCLFFLFFLCVRGRTVFRADFNKNPFGCPKRARHEIQSGNGQTVENGKSVPTHTQQTTNNNNKTQQRTQWRRFQRMSWRRSTLAFFPPPSLTLVCRGGLLSSVQLPYVFHVFFFWCDGDLSLPDATAGGSIRLPLSGKGTFVVDVADFHGQHVRQVSALCDSAGFTQQN